MAGSKKSDAPAPTIEVGDIVLAKVKGYPPWPARVIDPETAPPAVKKERPKGSKTTFYCVCFFPTGDHAWQVIAGLQKLQKHEIEAYINEPSKKNGDLLEGYKIALDPSEWDNNRAETLRRYLEEQKNAPIDELDEEEDDEKTGKKRKRDSEGLDKKKTSKKAPSTKVGVRTKADSAGPRPKKRGKKNGITSSELIPESEDEGAEKRDVERPAKKTKGEEDDEDEESMSEEAKMVKGWRHELQRVFLNKTGIIKAEDMEKASTNLRTVEEFGSKMTVQLLSSSKIGKVIKKMTALPPDAIPNDDQFKIRERSNALLAEWSKIATPATNGDPAAYPPPPPPASEPAAPAPAAPPAAAEEEPATANGEAEMEVDASDPIAATTAVAQETSGADAEADVEMKEDDPAPAPQAELAVEPAAEPAAEASAVIAA